MEFFSVITMVNAWKTQYIISGWLHTPYQTIFIVIYWILKISSLFDHYLWNSPVKRGGQPHGSDQCGYIHLLYRFIFCFTVVGVEHLCRLGCTQLIGDRSHDDTCLVAALIVCYCVLSYTSSQSPDLIFWAIWQGSRNGRGSEKTCDYFRIRSNKSLCYFIWEVRRLGENDWTDGLEICLVKWRSRQSKQQSREFGRTYC